MSGEQMSGHVMLTGGRGLWTTATAAVRPQCWANHVVLCTSMMLVITNDAVDRVTVTQFCFISKPAVFRRHLVGKMPRNVRYCDIAEIRFAGTLTNTCTFS